MKRILPALATALLIAATLPATARISEAFREPIVVYNNWAAYDELSDNVPLTEALAMRPLQEILRLRQQGVRIDAYVMDAYWFAPDGGYRTWRQPNWPDGPDRWLAACREHGLKPGLWFSTNNLSHLEPFPAWEDSLTARRNAMCLFAGGYLPHLIETLQLWYDRGVRIFKFDFAKFTAPHRNSNRCRARKSSGATKPRGAPPSPDSARATPTRFSRLTTATAAIAARGGLCGRTSICAGSRCSTVSIAAIPVRPMCRR
jgi:hypothetical protein